MLFAAPSTQTSTWQILTTLALIPFDHLPTSLEVVSLVISLARTRSTLEQALTVFPMRHVCRSAACLSQQHLRTTASGLNSGVGFNHLLVPQCLQTPDADADNTGPGLCQPVQIEHTPSSTVYICTTNQIIPNAVIVQKSPAASNMNLTTKTCQSCQSAAFCLFAVLTNSTCNWVQGPADWLNGDGNRDLILYTSYLIASDLGAWSPSVNDPALFTLSPTPSSSSSWTSTSTSTPLTASSSSPSSSSSSTSTSTPFTASSSPLSSKVKVAVAAAYETLAALFAVYLLMGYRRSKSVPASSHLADTLHASRPTSEPTYIPAVDALMLPPNYASVPGVNPDLTFHTIHHRPLPHGNAPARADSAAVSKTVLVTFAVARATHTPKQADELSIYVGDEVVVEEVWPMGGRRGSL
ncbi:hypothetical protein BDK51DRAFT_37341 [Blyttiomyces helicus]|uniref:SH3 domain-containing protein n=1 Tax=Blyttiomyces helicus TaxID=388810 RepID=A0A4P9W1S9_9FUNG|nr:hypothetical protein BDK51DRAFT_37341 [Blyttiomyces helicus]|eukprot:RKO84708.1 hypothetical protein BDK51DRAFT_37341 [Blyttiomyces helicus]